MVRHIWSRNIWQAKKFDVLPKSFHERYSMSFRNNIWINKSPETWETGKFEEFKLGTLFTMQRLMKSKRWRSQTLEQFLASSFTQYLQVQLVHNIYKSLFNLMLVAPASSWKVLKCLDKKMRVKIVFFLYLPPMTKKIQLKIWTKSKKIFCIVLRKGAIGHFNAGRVAMLVLWLLSALTVQPRILILHKLFKVK